MPLKLYRGRRLQLAEAAARQGAVVMRDDLGRGEVGRIEGRMPIGDEHDLQSLRHGGAAGRVDAELRLQPRDDDPLDAGRSESRAEIGFLEGAAIALLDNGFARGDGDARMDLPAL